MSISNNHEQHKAAMDDDHDDDDDEVATARRIPPSSGNVLQLQQPIFTESMFDERYERKPPPSTPIQSAKCVVRSWWRHRRRRSHSTPESGCIAQYFPIVTWLSTYKVRQFLLDDILAGFTSAIMHIPQGMAYGMLSAVGPVEGLYTAFVAPVVYAGFASSRHVSVGTFAITSMMIATVVRAHMPAVENLLLMRAGAGTALSPGLALTLNNTLNITDADLFEQFVLVRISTALCLSCGISMLLAGVLQLGVLASYLSDTLIAGFSAGAAVHIFTSQINSVLGITKGAHAYMGWFMLPRTWLDIGRNICTGHLNPYTLALSICCVTILIIFKEFINANKKVRKLFGGVPVPIELILVISATTLSYFLGFSTKPAIQIKTVGVIPVGLPRPSIPDYEIVCNVFGDCAMISFVAFTITISLARLFANKNGYSVDASTELRALGLCNVTGAFFSCIPASGAMTRSMVVNSLGVHTQLAGLVSSAILFVVLQALTPLLEPLPQAVLGAIIMVALKPLIMTLKDFVRILGVSLVDASIYFATFAGCLLADVSTGLIIGIIWSLATVLLRTQYPDIFEVKKVPGTELYRRAEEYAAVLLEEQHEECVVRVIRINAPVYFANVENCRARLRELIFCDDAAGGSVEQSYPVPAGKKGIFEHRRQTLVDHSFLARSSISSSVSSTTSTTPEKQMQKKLSISTTDSGHTEPHSIHASQQQNQEELHEELILISAQSKETVQIGIVKDDENLLSLPRPKLDAEGENVTALQFPDQHVAKQNYTTSLKNNNFVVVLDCSAVNFMDTSGVELFVALTKELRELRNAKLVFAACPSNVRELFRRTSSSSAASSSARTAISVMNSFYPSVQDAVLFSSQNIKTKISNNEI